MIGWSVIGPALQGIFSEIAINRLPNGRDASGDDTFKAEWVDGRKPWQDGKRFIITDPRGFSVGLTITSVSAIGEDETRRTLSEDGESVIETQVGQRKFVLQVQSLAIANGVNADWAMAITERARTRLTSRRIIDRLLAVDVSVIRCGPSTFASRRDGARMITSATMDVTLGTVVNEDDPVTAGWIGSVVITSHIQDTDGTQLPPSLQQVDDEISGTP